MFTELVPQNLSRRWSLLEPLFSSWERCTAAIKFAEISRGCPSVWKWNPVLCSCLIICLQPGCHCLLRKSDGLPESSGWLVDPSQWLSPNPVVWSLHYSGIGERTRRAKVGKTCRLRWRQFSKWRWEEEKRKKKGTKAKQFQHPTSRPQPSLSPSNMSFGWKNSPVLLLAVMLLWYWMSCWSVWVNCASCVPSQSLAHPNPTRCGLRSEKRRRPWCCASTAEWQLKPWFIISTVLVMYLKHSIIWAALKEINFIETRPFILCPQKSPNSVISLIMG